jgi:hypothetical protein
VRERIAIWRLGFTIYLCVLQRGEWGQLAGSLRDVDAAVAMMLERNCPGVAKRGVPSLSHLLVGEEGARGVLIPGPATNLEVVDVDVATALAA